MPDIRHILLTRFNLPIANFPSDLSGQPTRTQDWLEHRLRLFREGCVPSISAQTCNDFRWFLLVDAAGAAALRPRLAHMLYGIDAVILEADTTTAWRPALREHLVPLPRRLIVTRLDNDDALHPEYVRRAQEILLPRAEGRAAFPALPLVLNFSRGLCWNGEQFFSRIYHQNAFTTWVVDRADDDAAGFAPLPYDVNHVKVGEDFPVMDMLLPDPMWVQLVHARNASNRAQGTPVDALPEDLERAFGYLRSVAL